MKKLTDLEYLKLSKPRAFLYDLMMFLCAIPRFFVKLGVSILNVIVGFGVAVKDETVDIVTTFKDGNWAVKLSFLIFGFGNFFYGQIGRGLLFLLFEVISGKQPSDKFLERAQMVGMLLLLGLFILAFYNDLARFVF